MNFPPSRQQLRRWLPALLILVAVAATAWAIVWIHSAARTSSDAWPTAVAAGTTAALAVLTGVYVYLTFRLLDAQRSAPRAAAWETELRELSRYLAQQRGALWNAGAAFPTEKPDYMPPPVLELIARRDAIADMFNHLLDVMGLLPRGFQKKVLMLIIHLVEAHSEFHAFAAAIIEAQHTGLGEGRSEWDWEDARKAHEASDDPERSQPWADVVTGRQFRAAQEAWEQLSSDLDDHLGA